MKLFSLLAISFLIINQSFSFQSHKTIPDEYHGLLFSPISKSNDILIQKNRIIEGAKIWKIYYIVQKPDTLYVFGKSSEKFQSVNDNYEYKWEIKDEEKRFKIYKKGEKVIVNDVVLSKKEELFNFNSETPSNELNTQSFRVTVVKHPSLPFNRISLQFNPVYQNDHKVNRAVDSTFSFSGIIYSDQELRISPLANESFGTDANEDTLYYPNFNMYVSPGKHSQVYIDSSLNIHFLGHLADFNTQYYQIPKDTEYFFKLNEPLNKKDLTECIIDKLNELQKKYDNLLQNQRYSKEFKEYIYTDILLAKAKKISFIHNQNYNLQNKLIKKESKRHIPEYQLTDLYNEIIPDYKDTDIDIFMKKIDNYPFMNYFRYHPPGVSYNSEIFFLNFMNENKQMLSIEENEVLEKISSFSSNDTFNFSKLLIDGELIHKKYKYFFDSLPREGVHSEEEILNKVINFRKFLTENQNITKEVNDAFDNLERFYEILINSKNLSEDLKKYPKGITKSQAVNIYNQKNYDDNPNNLSFFLQNCKLYNVGLLKKNYPNLEFTLSNNFVKVKQLEAFKSELNSNKYHPLFFVQDFEDTFMFYSTENIEVLSKLEIIKNSNLDHHLKKYCYHFLQTNFANRQNLKYP